MIVKWDYKKHPCGNLFCRINKKGYCDAGYAMSLLCSAEDIYQNCKEKIYGEYLIKKLKEIFKFDIYKNKKNEILRG